MITIGLKYTKNFTVSDQQTAKKIQSGGLDVLATPALIGFMENCAWESVSSYMEEKTDTVGIEITMKHLAPTPIGWSVRCESELIDINGNILTFHIKAYDNKEKIGEAIHKRYIINTERFMAKTANKTI